MGLRQVLAVGALPLIEVGDCVQAQPIDSQAQPKIERPDNLFAHVRAVEIEVRLMGVKAVPVIGLGYRVPGPIGGFEILEDDAGLLIFMGGVTPYVIFAVAASRCGPAGPLEPGVLAGSMVDHQLGNDL
jgi:hypothetical protein